MDGMVRAILRPRGSGLCRVVLVMLCMFLAASCRADRPIVVVHYLPWFAAKPYSPAWGWHWKMNGDAFNPDKLTNGRRSIASHYYPTIGPYDSADPAVQEYHLLLMKLAGIDGFIVDWYGRSDLYDYKALHNNTAALVELADKIGLKVGICYEDQTINQLVEAKRIPASQRVAQAQSDLRWLADSLFPRRNYLKLAGQPVLLSFGSGGLSDEEWLATLAPWSGKIAYVSEHRRRTCAVGAFDWPQPSAGLGAVDVFYSTMAANHVAAIIPTAFPRFDDVYKEGNAQTGFPKIADRDGATFRLTLARALTSGAPIVQIATWNDWGEGTGIEPTLEFGTRDLQTVQKQIASAQKPDGLQLPLRLYRLRGTAKPGTLLSMELDKISHSLAGGETESARNALDSLEKSAPVSP